MTDLAVHGLALGRRVFIALAVLALLPIGVGRMMVENDALQIAAVIGIIRIRGGDLILQSTAIRQPCLSPD